MDWSQARFEDLLALDGEELVAACQDLTASINRLEGLRTAVVGRIAMLSTTKDKVFGSRVIGACEGPSLAHEHGCSTSVELVQRLTGESAAGAAARIRLGVAVLPAAAPSGLALREQNPALARAMESGQVGSDSAQIVSRTLSRFVNRVEPNLLARAERDLVSVATAVTTASADPEDVGGQQDSAAGPRTSEVLGSGAVAGHADMVRLRARFWEAQLGKEELAESQEAAFARRHLHLGKTREDGLVSARGLLTGEVAAALAEVTNTLTNPKAGSAASGEGAKAAQAPSLATARHDALATALNVALSSRELPSLAGTAATVVVEVREEAVTGGHETGRWSAGASEVGWLRDHEGMLSPLGLGSVAALACGGTLQKVVRTAEGRISALSSPARIFNAGQRRAIGLRDKHCVVPGCMVPAAWCEVHHVQPAALGGPTHTDNGVLVCYYHHRSLDTSGWKITMDGGVPKVEPPPWACRAPTPQAYSPQRE